MSISVTAIAEGLHVPLAIWWISPHSLGSVTDKENAQEPAENEQGLSGRRQGVDPSGSAVFLGRPQTSIPAAHTADKEVGGCIVQAQDTHL